MNYDRLLGSHAEPCYSPQRPAENAIGPEFFNGEVHILEMLEAIPARIPWTRHGFPEFQLHIWRLGRTKEQRLLQRERARIARDIHDDLGMRMTRLVLQGEVAQSELTAESGLHSHLNQMCEDARGTLRAMDEILWAINPRRDNLREFTTYVCKYAQTFLKNTPIECVLEVEPEMPALAFDLPLRRSLLLAVIEALNNVAKHSHASELVLRIRSRGQGLLVVVQDNGRGFDPTMADRDRNGLTNMSQRMIELGGSCHIASQPGKGCSVELFMPLVSHRRHLFRFDWTGIFSRRPLKKDNQTPEPAKAGSKPV